MKKLLSLFLTAAMVSTSCVPAFGTTEPSQDPPWASDFTRNPEVMQSGLDKLQPDEVYDDDEEVTVIIHLSPEKGGGSLLNVFGSDSSSPGAVQKEISRDILDGEKLEVVETYTNVINGFAAVVPYGKLEEIQQLPQVELAYVAPTFKIAPDMPSTMSALGGLENTSGYTGEGMKIAIIDSGLEVSHEAFRKAPANASMSKDDVASALQKSDLHAEQLKTGGVSADQLYYSAKIPFKFDYADRDFDVNPGNAGDHGTHVAGIASATPGLEAGVGGVAPESQLMIMKVFSSDGSGGATWDSILSAIDDAMALDADVINMSLGSTSGFATTDFDEGVRTVYENVEKAGVMLSVAAGNEYSAGYGNNLGKGHALTINPDYGTAAEPGSYSSSMAVASLDLENTIQSLYMTADGTRKIAFNDSTEDPELVEDGAGVVHFKSLAGKGLDYVVIPNFGNEADYEGLDVTGKIALVSRGNISYDTKKNAAKKAGAAGMVVYNNEPGMLYMQLDQYDFPCAFISQNDGEYLAGKGSGGAKLVVSATKGEIDSPTSGQMSDFSSWGVTPELTLKPEITAPGANIKSSVTNNSYSTKSGTSMAAPYVAGAMAATKEYVEHKLSGLVSTNAEERHLVQSLLMSTADVVRETNGTPYSPRKQGAGSVNVDSAVSTRGYITVPGQIMPKIELGDDVSKTGVYQLKFKVNNISDRDVTYTVSGNIQTDGAEVTKSYKGKDVWQTTERPYALSGEVKVSGGNTITVPAGSSVTVNAEAVLSAADKAYLDEHFENGMFVEGFVTLKAPGEVTLSVPYMGFYGDWTRASVIDRGYYWNTLNDEPNWATQYTNTAGTSSLEGTISNYLGDNPYHKGVPYLADRNAISPNGDDYNDALDILYTGLLRNVKKLTYTITGEDGTVYYTQDCNYIVKSVYSASSYRIVPAGVNDDSKMTPWFGTGNDNRTLPNGTRATVTVTAEPAYDKHAADNECLSWSFPITIDTEEPSVAGDITVREENGAFFVDMDVTDNQYVSNVCIANGSGDKQLASYALAETEPGKTTSVEYNVTGFGENLTIVVNDYAGNRKEYKVKAEGNVDDSEIIIPTKTVFKEDFEKDTFETAGWTLKSSNSKTWKNLSNGYGSRVAEVEYSKSPQDEWLISPSVNLKEQSEQSKMIFDFYSNYYYGVQIHRHNIKVKISSDNGENWEDIWQLWNVAKEFDAWDKVQAKVTIPEKYQDCENVNFAFVYEANDGATSAIDNVTVYVDDPDTIHSINATAGEGGSINPSGKVSINDGKSRTFTITPDEGHFVEDVLVDGESVGPVRSYTFEDVREDHTIDVTFGGTGASSDLVDENFDEYKELYPGSSSSTVLPTGWTQKKTNTAYTWKISNYFGHWMASCSNDYYEEDSGWGGWSAGKTAGASEFTGKAGAKQDEYLIMPAMDLSDKTATISFQFNANTNIIKRGYITVTLVGSTDGGTTWTTLWDAKDHAGDMKTGVISDYIGSVDQTLQLPDSMQSGSTLLAFRYQQKAYSSDGGPAYIDNIKVTAAGGSSSGSTEEKFDITASAGIGGTITPYGTQKVAKGADILFNITPGEGYEISDVLVDNVSVGPQDSYEFKNVTSAHTIEAVFAKKSEELPDSIHEDFNGDGLAEGWSIEGPSHDYNYESWTSGRFSALNDSKVMICSQNVMFKQQQNEKLMLPEIKMSDNMKMTFDFGGTYAELFSGSIKLSVKATNDKGQNWTEIWNAKDNIKELSDDEVSTETAVTGLGSIDIPAAFCTEGARFAFVFESSDRRNGTAAVDNVTLTKAGDAPKEKYAVRIGSLTGGTISAKPSIAAAGETVVLTVKPDQGYSLREGSLKANDEPVVDNKFVMPAKNVTVTAAFDKDPVETEGTYKDGTYEGSAKGKKGMIHVVVTVTDGKIANIEVTEQQETESFWKIALGYLEELIGLGSNEEIEAVDTETGATVSSKAIQQAVLSALENAKETDSGIFADGDGSKKNPYLIADMDQMRAFAEDVNEGNDYEGLYVALGANIDAAGAEWVPVGFSDHGRNTGFRGVFDGNGYMISNLECGNSVDGTASYCVAGVFGVIDNGGVVKNLNVSINKFRNVYSEEGEIAAIGGIAGVLGRNALIDHCTVFGGTDNNISTEGYGLKAYHEGGIAGRMDAGSMIANSWSDVGISAGTLDMDAEEQFAVGGIAGKQAENSLIVNCASFGLSAVSAGDADIHVGGIVGDTDGMVYNCYTMSSTRGNNIVNRDTHPTTAVGMLAGSASNTNAFYNCYYDIDANQVVDSVDMAGDPEEDKIEQRRVVGTASADAEAADLTNVYGKSAGVLASDEFVDTMNGGNRNSSIRAAEAFFGENLLTDNEDLLDKGYMDFELVGDRVLISGTEVKTLNVVSVALQKAIKVAAGTEKSELGLPEKVEVTLDNKRKVQMGVTWSCDDFDADSEGIYTFVGELVLPEGIENPSDKKAYVEVTVEENETPNPPGPTDPEPVVVQGNIAEIAAPAAKTVANGTAQSALGLPATVAVTLENGQKTDIPVTWSCSVYNASAAGDYMFTGTLKLPEGITNNNNLQVVIIVTVNAKSNGGSGGSGGSGGGGGGSSSGGGGSSAPSGNGGSSSHTNPSTEPVQVIEEPGVPAHDMPLIANDKVAAVADKSGAYRIIPKSIVIGTDIYTALGDGEKIIMIDNKKDFKDVRDTDWFKGAVAFVASHGILTGVDADNFAPNENTSRAMLATMLFRLEQPENKDTKVRFADVAEGLWYTEGVAWAAEAGIVKGLGADEFCPDELLTREQLAAMLYRYAKYAGMDVSAMGSLEKYEDAASVSSWAQDAVRWATATGVMNGRADGSLDPSGNATRAEVAAMIERLIDLMVVKK